METGPIGRQSKKRSVAGFQSSFDPLSWIYRPHHGLAIFNQRI